MKPVLILPLLLLLAACASAGKPSGLLSSYDGLTVRDGAVRTSLSRRTDSEGLTGLERVALDRAVFAPGPETEWLSDVERTLLLREVDAQVCFEVSERYAIVNDPAQAQARVRTIITRVAPTGRAGSAASAAAGFFIPGPIGLRVPGGLGGLGAEAEILDTQNRQLAAVVWNRSATAIGTDNPSLSRIGDALQLAEPFADAAAAAMTATGVKPRGVDKPDPCAAYGPRIRVEGFAARFATGLYVPSMSGARAEEATPPAASAP
jgi:hypothetical protein